MDSVTLDFYYKGSYQSVDNLDQIAKPYYLVINSKNKLLLTIPMHYINTVRGNTIDDILRFLLNKDALNNSLIDYNIFKVE
jgi:hypothetical protein